MGDRKNDIERYLRGELTSAEMHALEREALNDPFLAEALEGIEQAGRENFLYDLHSIRRSVRDRVRNKSRKKGKVINIWGWTTAIAATVLLLIVSGFIVLSILKQQAARQQALNNEPEPMPDEFTRKDTLVIILPTETTSKRMVNEDPVLQESPDRPATEQRVPKPVIAGEVTSAEEIPEADKELIAENKDDQTVGQPGQTDNLAKTEMRDRVSAQQAQAAANDAESSRQPIAAKRNEGASTRDREERIVVKGKVVDAEGQALPGVNVMVKDSNIGTVTDADGRYELTLPAGNPNVAFAFIGFESQEIKVNGQQELNVALKEDVASLSEVVVTGYGSVSNSPATSTFRFAAPSGGRSDFKDYLAKNVRYPAEALTNKTEGRVTVRFTVQANGTLTDFKVIKGIGSGCEEALIEAIRSGPAWQPSMQGDNPTADQVKVRYRFKLPE